MLKGLMVVAAALALAMPGAAMAKQCRDAKGKFVPCPAEAPAKGQRCKDARGKFAKCGSPGAKPA